MSENRVPCKECGELILPNAIKCRYCGADISKKTVKSKSKLKKIVLSILACLGIIFIACVAYLFYIMKYVDNKFTGEELFSAINEHRKTVGVQELQIDQKLCDNLVERWLAIREPGNGHKGFEEWAKTEGIVDKDGYMTEPFNKNVGMAELYGNGTQTYWLIDFWTSSPGHKLSLENPNYNVGCSYASSGTGVVIMAKK